MIVPIRLQLSRRKGFNLQATSLAVNGLQAVSVARRGRHGNPFTVERIRVALRGSFDWSGCPGADEFYRAIMLHDGLTSVVSDRMAAQAAVDMFARAALFFKKLNPEGFEEWITPLRSKNLACWCKPGDPCHADILLEIARAIAGRIDSTTEAA